jgi:hypothetical protein
MNEPLNLTPAAVPGTRRTFVVAVSRVLCGAIGAALLPGAVLAQSDDDAEELKRSVQHLADNMTSQSAAVQDWLRHSVIVAAERTSSFHDRFANPYQLQGQGALELPVKFGPGAFGVTGDAWLAAGGYNQDTTLNNAEMASLLPGVARLRSELELYDRRDGSLVVCPLVYGPRVAPDRQYPSFARLLAASGLDRREFTLLYYRFFIIHAKDFARRAQAFTPVIAYAYTREGVPGTGLAYSTDFE